MIITGPVESFFKNPGLKPSPEGDGILFHLRRDLERLYGPELQYTGDPSPHAMLAMIGMLAGIDYLSKVYSSKEHSGDRFVQTVEELCNVCTDDSEALYQLRCALVHSVALSTKSDRKNFRKGTRFNFEVTSDTSAPLIKKVSDAGSEATYRVAFWEVKKTFHKVIVELENIGRNISDPRNRQVINMIGQMHSEKILKS